MSKAKRLRKQAHEQSRGNSTETPAKDRSPRIPQRDKIGFDLSIHQRDDLTERQRQFIDLVMDKKTKLVFVDGPAGTSKTYLAVLCGLMLLNKRAVSDILYVRSVAESASKSLGYLPGDAEDKFGPFIRPMLDKIEELLDKGDADRLLKEKRLDSSPINYLRGASFNARCIISDESQNLEYREMVTLVTRLGEFSKMLVIGDKGQSDIGGKSGFTHFYDLFNDEASRENGIHCFAFTKDDIVRSGILRYIVERLEQREIQHAEPMFPSG